MATPHDKLASMNDTSPSEDKSYIEEDYEEYSPTRSPGHGCCFQHLCFRTWQKRENNNSYRHLTQQAEKSSQTRETWFSKNLKAAKEFSEVLAGPKWKNFIENKIFINSSSSSKKRRMQFQYDPQSYALNFDDGVDIEGDGGGGGVHIDFAARYSCRSSIDFDQEK